jgi:hypothetical protein
MASRRRADTRLLLTIELRLRSLAPPRLPLLGEVLKPFRQLKQPLSPRGIGGAIGHLTKLLGT